MIRTLGMVSQSFEGMVTSLRDLPCRPILPRHNVISGNYRLAPGAKRPERPFSSMILCLVADTKVLTSARRFAHLNTASPISNTSPLLLPCPVFPGCVRPCPGINPYGGPPFSHQFVLTHANVYPTPLSRTPTPPVSLSPLDPPA